MQHEENGEIVFLHPHSAAVSRPRNEYNYTNDSVLNDDESGVYIVCNAIADGPASTAEIVSTSIADVLSTLPFRMSTNEARMYMDHAVELASSDVVAEQMNNVDMGESTLAVMQFFMTPHGRTAAVLASVGNTRICRYRFTSGHGWSITHLTKDDTATPDMQTELKLAEAASFKDLTDDEYNLFLARHDLIWTFGAVGRKLISQVVEVQEKDIFSITNAGIHGNLTDSEMCQKLTAREVIGEPSRAVMRLAYAAVGRSRDSEHMRSTEDGMSAVVVEVRPIVVG